ncbi:hypothetical protein JNUCC1_02896 [Lentibacillus sp. JNUCC-1]|uniref:TIGR02677 family protein n=1 Tax=Lentibacillus sp. JNUCC-1 TaxID=2654513 RepID=UPI0012E82AEC|nr:TIGR02677 family protein [Lentibacillus sp. JNUCC-1]MUV39024.1 hypothetical protein [Lentibacillus sp. JNUCC-1]
MEPNQFRRVKEASYLTADKVWSYRTILRYFYLQHERMREFLLPEEIYAHLKEQPGFDLYTEEDLHQDLAQLVNWNNLNARQETGRSRSIEEFKKKRFRYQSTPYTIEFERMLEHMEKGGEAFGGSLEKKEFERLYSALATIETMLERSEFPPADECYQLWNDVFTYFRSIGKNTSDYMAHLNSEEAEERMQTEAFLVFKNQFTTYLRDFIVGLQQTASKIQDLLATIDTADLNPLIQQVMIHQKQVPRFEDVGLDEEALIHEQIEKWHGMCTWFLGNVHGESELEMLQERTNEQIRRITRVVQRLGERHHYFRSRKKDYLHLARWFEAVPDVHSAHELSSVVFGVFHTRHLLSDHIPTDDIYTDVWDEAPIDHETKPHVRTYREKTRPGAIVDKTKEKEDVLAAHLKQKKLEQETLEAYMSGDEIKLKDLPQIEAHVRKMLLAWIGKAMTAKDHTFKTEHGREVQVVVDETEQIKLKAEDGDMLMPAVTFRFLDQKVSEKS